MSEKTKSIINAIVSALVAFLTAISISILTTSCMDKLNLNL